jgi:hypothetical protein
MKNPKVKINSNCNAAFLSPPKKHAQNIHKAVMFSIFLTLNSLALFEQRTIRVVQCNKRAQKNQVVTRHNNRHLLLIIVRLIVNSEVMLRRCRLIMSYRRLFLYC